MYNGKFHGILLREKDEKRQITSEYYDKNRSDNVDPTKRSWVSQGSMNQTLKIAALYYLGT